MIRRPVPLMFETRRAPHKPPTGAPSKMQRVQDSVWYLIASLLVGPALTAAVANYILGRRLTKFKSELDTDMSKEVESHKATLQRELETYKRDLDGKAARRVEYETYLADQQAALSQAYYDIFVKGRTKDPSGLHDIMIAADDAIMGPFRRFQTRLPIELQHKIFHIHNMITQGTSPDGSPPSKDTIARLWSVRDSFYADVVNTKTALDLERSRQDGGIG
jgi:hypothetical protein